MPQHEFTTINNRPRLRHHFTPNVGVQEECEFCRTICDAENCYNRHWIEANDYENLVINTKQQRLLRNIIGFDIKVFIFSVFDWKFNRNQFIVDGGYNLMPRLLRLMFTQARELSVKVTFYVTIDVNKKQQKTTCSSRVLHILHYYDIAMTMRMVFVEFLGEIKRYRDNVLEKSDNFELWLTRIRLDVERIGRVDDGKLSLPAQYRVKEQRKCGGVPDVEFQGPPPRTDCDASEIPANTANVELSLAIETKSLSAVPKPNVSIKSRVDRIKMFARKKLRIYKNNFKKSLVSIPEKTEIKTITEIYRVYLSGGGTDSWPLQLSANLYAFRKCRDTRELFVVPVYLADGYQELPNYIILNDVQGIFRQLVPITNLADFLRFDVDDDVWCPKCRASQRHKAILELHRMADCKTIIEMFTPISDETKTSRHTIPLDMNDRNLNWSLHGIIEDELSIYVK